MHAVSDGFTDAVDEALASGITRASVAGEWAVVAQLAKELEARRLARADLVARGGTGAPVLNLAAKRLDRHR